MARKSGRPDQADAVVIGLEINARRRQIEMTTMQHGSGRHVHYASLGQAPAELRGEALLLIRTALANAGYASMLDLETALTSELVVPEEEADEAPPPEAAK
jgi:hypothetical protein